MSKNKDAGKMTPVPKDYFEKGLDYDTPKPVEKNEKSFSQVFKEASAQCVVKHTLNGDGSMGAYGDFKAVSCIIDKVSDHYTNKTVDKMGESNDNSGDDSGGGCELI